MPGRIRSSVVACLLLCATSLVAQVKVLKNFTLIDGAGHAPVAHAAMILENGRIAWVGPEAKLKPPPSASITDLQGKYIMPGIINLHVHLGATIGLDQNEKFFTPENVEKDLRTYASYGVTTVLSMGTDKDSIFKIRDAQRAGLPGVEVAVVVARRAVIADADRAGRDPGRDRAALDHAVEEERLARR